MVRLMCQQSLAQGRFGCLFIPFSFPYTLIALQKSSEIPPGNFQAPDMCPQVIETFDVGQRVDTLLALATIHRLQVLRHLSMEWQSKLVFCVALIDLYPFLQCHCSMLDWKYFLDFKLDIWWDFPINAGSYSAMHPMFRRCSGLG